ncbi:ATP-grasp fold amidoligase family protein [Maribacter sp. 1_MG-2023]|uniref:ATP-grasp fold amidoligase family protein n=1 Tax=Maribacter sp. 1_MG-2023 TaxID=3062677 RepID=UPI0026E39617|nr:ATP-grasp fold amidoligase family protein [Maribacter sp. 1_MG-2023]MDO6470558.1 ATP-grasp fold amidoligase family protein [Maribacter sp. 1_MG-2023]
MVKKLAYGILKKLKFLPQEFYVKIYYEYYSGNKLDYNNLKDFNEKISWYKVFYRPKILNQLVDKYNVKKYVENKVGKHILNETIGVFDKVSKIDFDSLPKQFVIKGVHGFHFNLIVKDKTKLNLAKSKYLLHKWMSKNQYYRGGMEWAYKDVKPLLLVEKYLEEMGQEIINDYKFFCFNGVPKFVQIDLDHGKNSYRCFYDMEWRKQDFSKGNIKHYKGEIEKPSNFNEMKEVALKLANNLPFVRIDLYAIEGRTIFGEMTFYPSDARSRFVPEEYNKIIGDYFILPKIPKGQKYITDIIQ